ncbi:MAG: hypothetical protein ACR2KV_09935 [Solirubrobacteraceae bacterium]
MSLTPIKTEARFKRAYKKKPKAMQTVIDEALVRLRVDPHDPALGTHKIRSVAGVWAADLDRGNRLTFHWDGDTIVLRNHCNHAILDRSP